MCGMARDLQTAARATHHAAPPPTPFGRLFEPIHGASSGSSAEKTLLQFKIVL